MARILLAATQPVMPILFNALKGHELLPTETTRQAERLILEDGIDIFVICVHFDDSRAMELVKLIRLDEKHKKTPILLTQIMRTEITSFLQQTMDVMKSLGVINDYLILEGDPLLERKLDEAVAFNLKQSNEFQVERTASRSGSAARVKGTVLIVDDTKISRLGTILLLQQLEYETEEAESGYEAISKIKTHNYSAILMDLQMPGMDGFECTKQIRAIENVMGRTVPIIGFTSCSGADIPQKCTDAGMNAFLDKDSSAEQVEQILAAAICKTKVY